MRFIFACLFALTFLPSFESKSNQLNDNLDNGIQLLKKVASDSNENLIKESKVIQPLIHDYMIEQLRENSFKALRKLTKNWKFISNRNGRQDDDAIGAIPITSITSSSELTFASINAGFRIANDVLASMFSILRTTFGYDPPSKSIGTTNTEAEFQNSATIATPNKENNTSRRLGNIGFFSRRSKDFKDLTYYTDSLRDKSYSDQLSGVLTILTGQNGSPNVQRDTIKSTVDSILDAYVATNRNPQALFLPQLFEGIPKQNITYL